MLKHSAAYSSVDTAIIEFSEATGGTVTTDGDYKIHTFTTTGTFELTAASTVNPMTILIVGGGGSGGRHAGGAGGGGGAGEAFEYTEVYMNPGSWTATIGAGGAGNTGNGNNGSPTIFYTYTAVGGGAGGFPVTDKSGSNGGSGGGGGAGDINCNLGVVSYRAGGTGTKGVGTGNNGFSGDCRDYTIISPTDFDYLGGNGGGYGPDTGISGLTAVNRYNGLVSDISGTSTYYAGGGGGGRRKADQTVLPGATGGLGGGGNGGKAAVGSNGANGKGGGGGGTGSSNSASVTDQGGNGGSGVVIIRYKFQ